jgi:hypothetical protein
VPVVGALAFGGPRVRLHGALRMCGSLMLRLARRGRVCGCQHRHQAQGAENLYAFSSCHGFLLKKNLLSRMTTRATRRR